MRRKRNKIIITSKEQFDREKPLYDGFAVGHGIHGAVKYNRRKYKNETKRIIEEQMKD